jgi:hypothetical protein
MKDFLEEKGFVYKPSPKDTFRLAQQSAYIDYAQALIDGFDIRNELSHDYSGEKFERFEKQLREETFVALEKLRYFFIREKQNLIP